MPEINTSDWERIRQVLKVEGPMCSGDIERWAKRWRDTFDRRAFYSLLWEMADAGAIVRLWTPSLKLAIPE
jgi:hypothetical protein